MAGGNIGKNEWTTWRGQKWCDQIESMSRMLAPINEAMISRLSLDQPLRIAEIGCGEGNTTRALTEVCRAGSQIDGYDVSKLLVDQACKQSTSQACRQRYILGDVSLIDPPPQPYDLLVSRFGTMFFEQPLDTFKRIKQWLVPGGSFLFAVWGTPQNNPVISEVRKVLSKIISMPSPPQDDAPGPFRYGEVQGFLKILHDAEFCRLKAEPVDFLLEMGGGVGAKAAAKFGIAAYSNYQERLAQEPEGSYDRALQALSSHLADFEQNGIVRLKAQVHFVSGTAPT